MEGIFTNHRAIAPSSSGTTPHNPEHWCLTGWPDMVFTANAGLVLGDTVVLSRFFHKERQGEEPFFKQWFEEALHST